MKSIIKSAIVFALMLLPVLSFGQDKATNFVENEFIIWLEQGVDAATFATNSNAGITPKRMLSKRLNIWLFEINDNKELREDKMSYKTTIPTSHYAKRFQTIPSLANNGHLPL